MNRYEISRPLRSLRADLANWFASADVECTEEVAAEITATQSAIAAIEDELAAYDARF